MANDQEVAAGTCKTGLATYVSENLSQCGQSARTVWAGYALAWGLFFLICKVLPLPQGLRPEGMAVLAILVWASVMWVSEAMPVGITGISIPTLLVLTRAIPWNGANPPMGQVFSGFTTHEVWLCLFAFFAGAIIQLLKMDKRIALAILDAIKASSVGRIIWGMFWVNVVLAFLIPAANARAATVMPVVAGITSLLGDTPREREAKKAIVIQSMVYASMISGIFILTGHMPNLIMTGLFDKNGFHNLGYFSWMALHVPYILMFALTQWWVRFHFKTGGVVIAGGHEEIRRKHKELGPMTGPEWAMLAAFALVGVLFMTGKGSPLVLHSYQLGIVGLVGIMILFIPGLFPFKWKAVQDRTIWGTFLLLGGAITMTDAMSKSGPGLVDGRAHPSPGGRHGLVADASGDDAGHAGTAHRHALQRGGRGHAGAHRVRHGPQGGAAPGGLHAAHLQRGHLRLPPAHPDHGGGHRLWHGHLLHRGLRPLRLGVHPHGHRLRHLRHGPVVCLPGPAGVEPVGPLALLITFFNRFTRRTYMPRMAPNPASLDDVETVRVDCDILIIGGGNAGCFSAVEAAKIDPSLKVVIMEKAHILRSGACSAGMDAINTYIPEGKTPEDLVRWCRSQVGGGPIREDLALSNARELNESVDDLERWGLPILRDENGKIRYRGAWDISIHGEQLKPIMAEKALEAGAVVYNRVACTQLLMDKGRCVGALGFGVRDAKFYVFRAKATINATGGAAGLYKSYTADATDSPPPDLDVPLLRGHGLRRGHPPGRRDDLHGAALGGHPHQGLLRPRGHHLGWLQGPHHQRQGRAHHADALRPPGRGQGPPLHPGQRPPWRNGWPGAAPPTATPGAWTPCWPNA